jgi:hypothetical protein
MRVLLDHIPPGKIPPELLTVLRTAKAHWGGQPQVLVEAKEECWSYLERWAPGDELTSPTGRFVRALLCLLEPEGDFEAQSMTAEWFARMTDD